MHFKYALNFIKCLQIKTNTTGMVEIHCLQRINNNLIIINCRLSHLYQPVQKLFTFQTAKSHFFQCHCFQKHYKLQ